MGIFDTGSCYANLGRESGVVLLGRIRYSSWVTFLRVNLGWCNDDRHAAELNQLSPLLVVQVPLLVTIHLSKET